MLINHDIGILSFHLNLRLDVSISYYLVLLWPRRASCDYVNCGWIKLLSVSLYDYLDLLRVFYLQAMLYYFGIVFFAGSQYMMIPIIRKMITINQDM